MTFDLARATGRNDVELGVPANSAERDTLSSILGLCFAVPETAMRALLEAQGMQSLVVLRHDGEVVGGLILVDMGQNFGGRRVPMCGVAAVGIAPERRGEGFGRALVRGSVAFMESRGTILSALYPATVPLYRSGGYELAGSRFEHVLPLDNWTQRAGELRVREANTNDFAAMERAHSIYTSVHDGTLDRGEYIWNRVRTPRGDRARHYVVEGADGIAAYASMLPPKRIEGGIGYHLELSDVVVNEAEAGRRLLAFLSTHGSLADTLKLHGAACPELLGLLPEWRPKTRLFMHWMSRVINVPAALCARGYAPGLQAELSLQVTDDLCDEHAGNWILLVKDGVASVEPGGPGEIEISARGAAAIFGGFLSPRVAARRGLLHAPPESLDRLGALFAGSGPWMMEMF